MTKTELDALAHKIAESASKSDIETCAVWNEHSGRYCGRWYDLDSITADEFFIDESIPYLEARGLLKRHPENSHLVRW